MAIYQAPAVSYPTGRSLWLATVLIGILLLGAITAAVYSYQTYSKSQVLLWQSGMIAAAWLFAAVCVRQFLRQLERGLLDWDGVAWHWVMQRPMLNAGPQANPADQEGAISLRFDGQRCMLIKFDAPLGQSQWLWLEQSYAPERWHAVRRAVYSRAKAPLFNTLH